jgi:hypothetical protein
MRPEDRATKVNVVLVQYTRPTGQKGSVYIDPTWVSAVAILSSVQCSVLIGDAWLDISMSAEDFLTAIGVTPP